MTTFKVQPIDFPTFRVVTGEVEIATNKSMISIVNGSSDKMVRVQEVYIMNTRTKGSHDPARFLLNRCTGHSDGVDKSSCVSAHDTADTLDAGVSVRVGATITGEGSVPIRCWEFSADGWNSGPASVESHDHITQVMHPAFSVPNECKPIILRAGEGLTLKQTNDADDGSFVVALLFTQVEA